MSTTTDENKYFFGYMGIASALVFANLGAGKQHKNITNNLNNYSIRNSKSRSRSLFNGRIEAKKNY